ncbi:MAG: Asp23/Gls24 family envelope stress response protein [Oscillospiraceae bacterium]|nr:Asp23/Gls24 family envelope stress response protein [Oscillospiraceae bacterium]
MSDSYMTTVTGNGSINIAEDVLSSIVAAAVSEVDGVSSLANAVGSDIIDYIGKRTLPKGVRVLVEDGAVTVDVLIIVTFGSVVTTVAKAVQEAVSQALEAMAGVSSQVNVHVSGVSFRNTAART